MRFRATLHASALTEAMVRQHQAWGVVILVRYADDVVAGFENEGTAKRFLADLRQRMAKFALSLHPDKTRLIRFGGFAAERQSLRPLH